jgi:acetyl-CoA C-acetyltransferase
MTSAERARDCRKPPVWITGFGEAASQVQMSQMEPLTSSPARFSGPRAFDMAGVSHDDIDVAQLYDAFTITPLLALEDLGFCDKGDGGPFVEAGNIRADGSLPINTDGGGLSSNHPGKRGVFIVIEAVRQLRGEGPGVQIEGAKTALVNGNGGFFSAAATMILTT